MYQDRWYQTEAHNTFFDYVNSASGNPIIAIPTGAGKSLIIARIIQTIFRQYRRVRVLMLTHVTKLVVQNAEKLKEIWPHAPLGFYCAELRRKQPEFPIVYGTILSVFNALKKDINALGRFDLVLVDECHLVGTEDKTAYLQVLAFLKTINDNLTICGLSATPYREKLGTLTGGDVFTDTIYDLTNYESFNRLVDEGYLSPVVSRPTDTQIDTSGIKITAGEFNQKQAAEATEEVINEGVRETIFWGQSEGRVACLAFAPNVATCEHIKESFLYHGISAESCHSKKPNTENESILENFQAGEFQVVVSMAKLTTGYDYPAIDLIADFQPTNSTARHVQKGGRVMRISPATGKRNGRYLDFAGNLLRCGPFNDPVMPRMPGERGGVAPVKECPQCYAFNHASALVCGGKNWREHGTGCGYNFPPPDVVEALDGRASDAMAMRTEDKNYVWVPVQRIYYKKFQSLKTGQPPFLRVEYVSGSSVYNEPIRIEHGPSRKYAEKWWKNRTAMELPATVDEALNITQFLRQPKRIMVETTAKYPPVEDYEF